MKKKMHGRELERERERETIIFFFCKCSVTHFGHYVKLFLPTVRFKCIILWSFREHAEPFTAWPHYIQGMLQVL